MSRLARLHGTMPHEVLAGLGVLTFVFDTLFVRAFPGWVDGTAGVVAVLYAATLAEAFVLVLLLRVLLRPARLIEAVAVIVLVAAALHGVALSLAPGLYGEASARAGGAGWVLFGSGAMLAGAVLLDRRRTR